MSNPIPSRELMTTVAVDIETVIFIKRIGFTTKELPTPLAKAFFRNDREKFWRSLSDEEHTLQFSKLWTPD